MPELGGFAKIAPYLTNPLVLAGFALFLLLAFLRALLKSPKVAVLTQKASGQVLLRAVNYGFIAAVLVILLGFALVFYQTQRTTVDIDKTLGNLLQATSRAASAETRLAAVETERARDLEEIKALHSAVAALAAKAEGPDPPPGIDKALAMLNEGKTGDAEKIFAGILERKQAEGATALKEAAEAARHLGALAYLNDTRKAIEAYATATKDDPGDTWSWIFLGRLRAQAGDLAAAEQAFLRAQEAAKAAGDERDIGVAHHELGMVRQTQGDLAGALTEYEQYRGTAEKLAARDPGNAGWQSDLSVSFERIGDVRLAKGDLDGALNAYQEDLVIAQKLAAQDPGNAGWQRDLSVSFEKIGDAQSAKGDLDGALNAYQDSLAIRQKLAAQDPGNAEWQRDLSVSFERIGDVQSAKGDQGGALKAYQGSLAIREKLAAQDPGNAGWQRDLSVSFNKIGEVQSAKGDLDGALKAYQDSLAIFEKLAAQDPGNAGWQRDLSISLNFVGNVLLAKGDLEGALKNYQAYNEGIEKLAAQDPGNAGWQRDLSVSFERIGDVRLAKGDLDGALNAYQEDLVIAQKLAAQDPGNAGWQRDLSFSFNEIGDVQSAKGDLGGALKAYQDSHAIREKLAAQDPGNAGWQRDLAQSLTKLGNIRIAEGDLKGTLEAYWRILPARELRASFGRPEWQAELIEAHVELAEDVSWNESSVIDAERHYQEALSLLTTLQQTGKLTPSDAWMVEDLAARLAALRARPRARD